MAWTAPCSAKVTEPLYLDVHLPAGASFEQVLPEGHNAFIFTYRGAVKWMARQWRRAAWRSWPTPRCGRRDASTDEASRFILIAGQPLNEPIAQYGRS
jgi:redox-sensitive bicupin YhaK (pirin superfamily)